MSKSFNTVIVCLLCLLINANLLAKECELDNKAHRAMPDVEVTYRLGDDVQHTIIAKLADNITTRAAGFQRICASVIAAKPILFVFQQERIPSFHMNNVVASIDIAFIDKHGAVDSFHAMQPYSMVQLKKPLYSSSGPVIAALETYPGFFSKQGIDSETVFSWQPAASHSRR